MERIDEERIREALRQAAVDGRISCHAARELAARLEVPTGAVGEACNQLKIKIKSCDLGCF